MNVKKYSETPRPGQLTEKAAKQKAHELKLKDLTLNRKGMWIAFDYSTGEQVTIEPNNITRN